MDEALRLRRGIAPDMAYTAAAAAVRKLSKLRAGRDIQPQTRIAVLGGATTSQLVAFLDLFLFAKSVEVEIYEAPFGLIRQELLDPTSQLYSFKPNFVFIASNRGDLGPTPPASASSDDVAAAAASVADQWQGLWQVAHDRLGCQIIQNNFERPPWRTFGNLEAGYDKAPGNFIDRVNRELVSRAPRWVSIHDLDGLAAAVGRWNWGDDRFFHLAKLPCAPEHLVVYAHNVASQIVARLGRSRKCLVLDLDNTVWGGVVGDDGMRGIKIGQGDAEGEAFAAFQRYAKALSERGVILAVCSKNEDVNAREPFQSHSDMVLRIEDISSFVANWEDKATNLRRIALELNIGLDALVFVDDNPAERELVREMLPEVAVPEMPLDPADYIRAVDQHQYFEMVAVSNEDLQRTEMYRANTQRQFVASSASDLDGFLKSLEMRGWVGAIGDVELDRSAQLVGKSNQFNLTTRRYSVAEIEAMASNPNWVTRAVKLTDRFGDNGLISVLLAEIGGDALVLDTWLMSCRVLKRGVEQFLLNHLAAVARERGLTRLTGEYIPTAKNVLVKEHYAGLGFTQTAAGEDGSTAWELRVDETWRPLPHHISERTP